MQSIKNKPTIHLLLKQMSVREHKEWWPNSGQLKVHCFYNQHGKIDGKYKVWHRNGKLWMQHFYRNGKLHGEYKQWFTNGKLDRHCFYQNGKRHGEHVEWSEHCFYQNGKLHGECKHWGCYDQLSISLYEHGFEIYTLFVHYS